MSAIWFVVFALIAVAVWCIATDTLNNDRGTLGVLILLLVTMLAAVALAAELTVAA